MPLPTFSRRQARPANIVFYRPRVEQLESRTLLSFVTAPQYPVGNYPYSIATGDFTGDGILDLAVANASGTVSILLGNGDGTFRPAIDYPAGQFPISVAVGDFAGNGRLDLAVVDNYANTVNVLLGNGDGSFQAPISYAVGARPSAVATADFNGDGIPDLAMAD